MQRQLSHKWSQQLQPVKFIELTYILNGAKTFVLLIDILEVNLVLIVHLIELCDLIKSTDN